MDPFSTAAGVITVVQLADRVIQICKWYIEATRDGVPSDLRHIFVETSTLKAVLDSLHFLSSGELSQHEAPSTTPGLGHLLGDDGPVEACRRILTTLSRLLRVPQTFSNAATTGNSSKSFRVKAILAALAWPLKEGKARKLLAELAQHKATIMLAFTTDTRQVTWILWCFLVSQHKLLFPVGCD